MKVFHHLCLISILAEQIQARTVTASLRHETEKETYRKLSPADLGTWHNKIVTQVHDKISEKMPSDSYEYEKIMIEEISTMCPDGDFECRYYVRDYVEESKRSVPDFLLHSDTYDIQSELPKGYNDEVKKYISEIYDSVYLLDSQELSTVVETIDNINKKAQKSELSDGDRDIVESVASIAKGSSELWVDAHKDENNAFHQLQKEHNRKLQFINRDPLLDLVISPVRFVLADIRGATIGSVIPAAMASVTGAGGMALTILQTSASHSLYAAGIYIPGAIDLAKCALHLATGIKECNRTTLFGPYFDGTKLPLGGSNDEASTMPPIPMPP